MAIVAFFAIGAILGFGNSYAFGAHAHLIRYNNVTIAIAGALVGGLGSDRLGYATESDRSLGIVSVACAITVAVALLAVLAALRRWSGEALRSSPVRLMRNKADRP